MSECSPVTVLTKWLDQYLNFEHLPQKNIFWLDTMQYLCKRFGNPEKCCPSFHVAGSKGKGSISMMIACILKRAGYNTGLYTSPHILEFIERVGTPSGQFSNEVYEKSVRELMNGVQSIIPEDLPKQRPITWFELVTLFAMLCFRNAKTDMAVYEVGLGGRLDATNVISPLCCCIGPIELEHTEFLGDTVEKIAAEKGGIIKQGIPVIVSPQKKGVREVFKTIAAERNAPIVFVEDVLKRCEYVYKTRQMCDTAITSHAQNQTGMEITLDCCYFKRPVHTVLKMLGSFQAQNAAVASIAVKTIYPELDESIIEQGLADAVLPGRFEIVQPVTGYPHIPELILDGAHTVNSVTFTMETFKKLFESQRCSCNSREAFSDVQNADLLFACAADKDIEDIAPLFKDNFEHVMLTKPGETKTADMVRLEKAFTAADIEHETCGDYVRAIGNALQRADENHLPLLVTGSFYLVAEVKKFLLGRKCVS